MEWDTAAADIIVREAGGAVLQAGKVTGKGELLENWRVSTESMLMVCAWHCWSLHAQTAKRCTAGGQAPTLKASLSLSTGSYQGPTHECMVRNITCSAKTFSTWTLDDPCADDSYASSDDLPSIYCLWPVAGLLKRFASSLHVSSPCHLEHHIAASLQCITSRDFQDAALLLPLVFDTVGCVGEGDPSRV